MAKPTQAQLKAAVTDMLRDALGELQGTLSLDQDYFTHSYWYEHGFKPYSGRHEKDECAFWIDNPHEKWRPILVKVSVPRPGEIGY